MSKIKSPGLLHVCDSFQGLPPMDRNLHAGDKDWDIMDYLPVPVDVVIDGFRKYSLLDSQVVFAKGFFSCHYFINPLLSALRI